MHLLFSCTGGSVKSLLKSVVFISGSALFIAITGVSVFTNSSESAIGIHYLRRPMQHWVVTVLAIFEAFIYSDDGLSAAAYFNHFSRLTETLANIFLALSLLVGDSMIVSFRPLLLAVFLNTMLRMQIYRLWVVWAYNKVVIIFPLLSLLGLLSMSHIQ